MPYLKFSNKEYLILTSIAYFSTVAIMFIVNAFIETKYELPLTQVHWEILTGACALAEPIITFVIPGYFFYKMSNQNDLK
jgi:hypothetical protein